MAVETICNFFKYGYCKFKMSCKNKHVTLVCNDDKCNQSKCEKRHPRLCKYISNYGSCKLGSVCAYSHDDHKRKNENERLEKKLDELIAMVTKKNDIIEDLLQRNREKEAIIDKLVNDVKELDKIVKGKFCCNTSSSTKNKENEGEEPPSKFKDVTLTSDDKKKSLRSSKKKNNEVIEDFTTTCLTIVDETEGDMKNDTDVEIIRQKYKICTEKIDKEVIEQNVVADFGLQLMLTNMKLVNDSTPKEMIILRLNCLRRGLSDYKLKSLDKDRKK